MSCKDKIQKSMILFLHSAFCFNFFSYFIRFIYKLINEINNYGNNYNPYHNRRILVNILKYTNIGCHKVFSKSYNTSISGICIT